MKFDLRKIEFNKIHCEFKLDNLQVFVLNSDLSGRTRVLLGKHASSFFIELTPGDHVTAADLRG